MYKTFINIIFKLNLFTAGKYFVHLEPGIFSNCSNLQFVTLLNTLRSIPGWFFEDCTALTHFQIPESVQWVGEDVSPGSGLCSVTIPDNICNIIWGAFRDCVCHERVIIHPTDLYCYNNIFYNCPVLSVIMIAPWLWPQSFVSMNGHPKFIFKFFRQYLTQILDGDGGG